MLRLGGAPCHTIPKSGKANPLQNNIRKKKREDAKKREKSEDSVEDENEDNDNPPAAVRIRTDPIQAWRWKSKKI